MLTQILSRAWWIAAGQRAARTALVVLLGVLRPLIVDPASTWGPALSTVALAVLVSLATSLASLPETDGTGRSWARAALSRAARTAGQTLVAGVGSSVLWSDVAWTTLWQTVAVATLGTVLLAAISVLPETIPLARVGADGVPDVTSLPSRTSLEQHADEEAASNDRAAFPHADGPQHRA